MNLKNDGEYYGTIVKNTVELGDFQKEVALSVTDGFEVSNKVHYLYDVDVEFEKNSTFCDIARKIIFKNPLSQFAVMFYKYAGLKLEYFIERAETKIKELDKSCTEISIDNNSLTVDVSSGFYLVYSADYSGLCKAIITENPINEYNNEIINVSLCSFLSSLHGKFKIEGKEFDGDYEVRRIENLFIISRY